MVVQEAEPERVVAPGGVAAEVVAAAVAPAEEREPVVAPGLVMEPEPGLAAGLERVRAQGQASARDRPPRSAPVRMHRSALARMPPLALDPMPPSVRVNRPKPAAAAWSAMEAAMAPAMGLETREPALKTAPVLELPNNINFV